MRLGENTSCQLFTENFFFHASVYEKKGVGLFFYFEFEISNCSGFLPSNCPDVYTGLQCVSSFNTKCLFVFKFSTLKFKWDRLLRPRDSTASVRNRKFRNYAQILTQGQFVFPLFEMKRINCAWTNVLLSVDDQLFTVTLIHSSKRSSSRNSWMVVNGRSHFPRIMPFLFTSIYSKVQRTSIWFFFQEKRTLMLQGKSLCFYLASTYVFSGGGMRRMT
jgi:hypothetical protein